MRPAGRGRSRVRPTLVVLVLLLAAGALSCSGGDAETPAKPPFDGSVVEWNMSGWSQHRGSAVPVDALTQRLQTMSPPPAAIVLVEVCSSQFELLRARLGSAPLAYRSASAWSIPAFGQPSCASYGNAVFWQGETEPDGVQTLTFPDDVQADGARTQEQRNLLCAAFRTPETPTAAATPLRVCATHLHRFPVVGEKQFAVVRQEIERLDALGPATLLVGDLNLEPTSPALGAWYAGTYVEADLTQPSLARPTTRAMRKLDYAFAPAASVHVTQPADLTPMAESDHVIYTAHVAVHG